MTRIVLHIDRLVLDGVLARQRDGIEQALVTELQRLLSHPGAGTTWAGLGHVDRLRGTLAPGDLPAPVAGTGRPPAPALPSGRSSATALGRAAARSLVKAVQR